MSKPSVRFGNVWKRFRLGETHDSLRDLVTSGVRSLLGGRVGEERSTFWALRDVDFTVARGEAVGIIGPNGAGKSTALRLMAGILRADRGEVAVAGRLAALIEVGAGFHGDLTGRENIFLNGAILGMRREEIRCKLDTIVEFAGLARFLDMPVKRYSSGMYARLGFSIAAHVDPDILLVDEVLSVGDAVFRLRCEQRMRELVRGGKTLVFVTHNLEQMQSICRRAIVLEDAVRSFDGLAADAVEHYMVAMSRAYAHRSGDISTDGQRRGKSVELLSVRFLDGHGEEIVWISPGEVVHAEIGLRLSRAIPRLTVELAARASVGQNALCFNSARDDRFFESREGVNRVTLTIPTIPLAGGRYFWNVRIWDADLGTVELDTPFSFPMVIEDRGGATGLLALEHEWSFDRGDSSKRGQAESPEAGGAIPALTGTGETSEGLSFQS